MSNLKPLDMTSLTAYKAQFLDYLLRAKGASQATVRTYEIALRQMLEVCELDEGVLYLMPYRKQIATQNKKTITKKLSAVRSFVRYINEIEAVTLKLKDDTPIKTPKSLPKPIEHEKIVQALHSAQGASKLIVAMLYGLGLRISELSHIKIVDIKPRWIRVIGKGDKMRDVPLSKPLYTLIQEYMSAAQPKVYLFEKKHKKLSEDSLRYMLMKSFKRIGIKATPHQLRHAYATQLLNGGAKIEEISELMGHESIATTQVYTQLASKQKMQAYMQAHPLMMHERKD